MRKDTQFRCKKPLFQTKTCIFAAQKALMMGVTTSGLTGFDSGLRWYVSMRSDGCVLHNTFGQKIIWRKQLRSRCLTEVQ